MKVSDVAKLTGVTVRTLHYYDEIGLLPPSEVTSSGYRVYNDADLEVLQQILFFRELDFSLEEIRGIMQNPAYEKETALQNQKALLVQKRDRLDRLIALVDKTLKGERDMSFKQFDTTKIEEAKQQYAAEVTRSLFTLPASTCCTISMVASSVTRRPLAKWLSTPTFLSMLYRLNAGLW